MMNYQMEGYWAGRLPNRGRWVYQERRAGGLRPLETAYGFRRYGATMSAFLDSPMFAIPIPEAASGRNSAV